MQDNNNTSSDDTNKQRTNDGDGGGGGGSMPKSPLLIRTLSSASSRITGSKNTAHSIIGILLITLGSLSFSLMFLFVKLMQGKANSFTVAFYRALVEIPIALYLINEESEEGSNNHNKGIDDFLGPSRARSWLLVRGGTGGAAVLCFFYAIQHLSLPDAVTLQFTTPPFAAAFAVLFAGERWRKLDMVGAAVCLFGVMLIAHPAWLFGETAEGGGMADDEHANRHNSIAAVAIALIGAAFAGLAYTSVRIIGHDASANVMVLYYSAMSLPVTLMGSECLLGDWNVWAGGTNLNGRDWCWMLLTGITAYAGQYMTNLGLQHETAATGTLATCSQIVFTYFFELAFLHEAIHAWSVAGTVLILGFMVIVGVVKMNESGGNDGIHRETVAGEPEELALMISADHRAPRSYQKTAAR
mmetsp:Transcript_24156/g.51217  ORF Transcript_24156/g.51217 Transcript_24156/m.51217 type:complete len:413 (-) Transcript_24156:102-1340(-)|eukprot:CAMPEP_0183729718 /NCGR_PEP_ID=MMETSP0737-20130205/31021_1 /TAXON_ID=385413 /ORGANISM="Thalassiosira miniscula, Strain CCMP1093" /LENGTH=412 /DNA_ID=CAMNT_0025961985 /DNA_START=211 /DNA_END=1449 /DNA_ORIENTATION=+